jgi:hypothetical protein
MAQPRLGGYPSNARPAGEVRGSAPYRGRVPADSSRLVQAGGVPWEGEPIICSRPKKDGSPCEAKVVKGTNPALCIGHQRQVAAETKE